MRERLRVDRVRELDAPGVEGRAAPVPPALVAAHAEGAVGAEAPVAAAASLRRGPSADGVPGADAHVDGGVGRQRRARRGTRRSARARPPARAARRPSSACDLGLRREAQRQRRAAARADAAASASTAAGSTRWSKAANSSVSRRAGPPSGWRATSRGGGVSRTSRTRARGERPADGARACPPGRRPGSRVAIGKRPSGSKTSVLAPTQRHSPGGCGESRTGTASRARRRVRVERHHRLREGDRRGAARAGTSPSGMRRRTSSGPVRARRPGRAASSARAGRPRARVRPVRGGGSDASRSAKGSSRGSAASGGQPVEHASRLGLRRARSAGGRATSAGASPGSAALAQPEARGRLLGDLPCGARRPLPGRLTSAAAHAAAPVRREARGAERGRDREETTPTTRQPCASITRPPITRRGYRRSRVSIPPLRDMILSCRLVRRADGRRR